MNRRAILVALLAALAAVPGAEAVSPRQTPASPQLAVSVRGRIVVLDAGGRDGRAVADRNDGRAVVPAWSRDGKLLAYVRLKGRTAAVLVAGGGGADRRRLTRDFRANKDSEPRLGQPAWSPDGRRVAFAAASGIYVATVGGALRRIAPPTVDGDGRPQWLASGRLAFCRGYSDNGVLVDPATGRTTDISRANCGERGPFWSPDGSRYLLARGDARSNAQLLVVDTLGRRAKLTNDVPRDPEVRFDDCCARWSQDGSRIVFLSDRVGQFRRDAFVVGADGSGERRLTWTGDVSGA